MCWTDDLTHFHTLRQNLVTGYKVEKLIILNGYGIDETNFYELVPRACSPILKATIFTVPV